MSQIILLFWEGFNDEGMFVNSIVTWSVGLQLWRLAKKFLFKYIYIPIILHFYHDPTWMIKSTKGKVPYVKTIAIYKSIILKIIIRQLQTSKDLLSRNGIEYDTTQLVHVHQMILGAPFNWNDIELCFY